MSIVVQVGTHKTDQVEIYNPEQDRDIEKALYATKSTEKPAVVSLLDLTVDPTPDFSQLKRKQRKRFGKKNRILQMFQSWTS